MTIACPPKNLLVIYFAMAASTTHSSRVNLSLTSIDYYSLYAGVGLGYDGAVFQIQVLAKPPFTNADTQVQSIFSYMSYQAETGTQWRTRAAHTSTLEAVSKVPRIL